MFKVLSISICFYKMSFRSDISKLIFHHLVKEGYESSAYNLVRECPYLVELKPVQPPYKLPRLMGPSLMNLIENYFETKESIVEQLELLESVIFREQDDLLNLTKTLVENLKFQTSSKPQGQRETSDTSVNTEAFSKYGLETYYAVVKTESASNILETCDVIVNTESISTPKTSDPSCNTEYVRNKPEACDASVNTEVVFNQEKNDPNYFLVENSKVFKENHDTNEVSHVVDSLKDVPNQLLSKKLPATLSTTLVSKHGCERSINSGWVLNHALQENSMLCSEQLEVSADTTDFPLVYDQLLEDRDLQEMIAENINKKKDEVILHNRKSSSKRGSLASSQDLDTVIKAIISETQTDPAFDYFLKDCIGSPESTAQDGESTVSQHNGENQEICLIPDNLGASTIVKPSTITSSIFTAQNPDLLENVSVISGLNGLAFLTSSGQTTLVPTIISAMPSNDVPSVGEKRKKTNLIVRRPVVIAPKPAITVTIPAPDSSYQFPNASYGSQFFERRLEDQQQLVDCNIETINAKTRPGPSTTRPMKVKIRPLTLSKRKRVAKTGNPVIQASQNPHLSGNFITPDLAAYVKIAQEYGSSTTMDIRDQEAVVEKESLKSHDVISNSHISNSTDFVSTPISIRRLSHVNQLNSGEAPELSNNPASVSPVLHPKRSEIPKILVCKNAVAAPPPSNGEIFAPPKVNAERRRKSSLAPAAGFVSQQTPRLCDSTDSSHADSAAPFILHEMANAPIEVIETASAESLTALRKRINERIAPEPNLSNFGMNAITLEEPVIQQPLPILASPRKEITQNVAGVNSINCFGAWDGEIPRTPQIQPDLTSSTSPFQVLLTKGFRFLPAVESPCLPVPVTPYILNVNSSNTSIETPSTRFYQFPSLLSTLRLEGLKQEIMESPGKSLSIAVISPTQVVRDRPTLCSVPSGERAQGHIIQHTIPEHFPEIEKLKKKGRSSTVTDPLQPEESNGASDAAETVAAAIQPNTLYETDKTLENQLIGECKRLEHDPSPERAKLRSQRLVELFGDDSRNPRGITKSAPSVPENAPAIAMVQITPITTKQKTRKSRRTANSKIVAGNEPVNSACARAQIYSMSPQAHRRKSLRLSNNSKSSTPRDDEDLIQEVLALSRLNSSFDPVARSPLNSRKRRSNSTNREKSGLTNEVSSEKRPKRKRSNFPNVSDASSEQQVLPTNEVMPMSIPSPSSSTTVPIR